MFNEPNGAAPPADANQNIFGGKSIEWGGNDNDPNAKTIRLRDRLNEADTERRKEREAAEARERAAEIRREERLKKIAYMNEMPDSTPAGTGELTLFRKENKMLSFVLIFCWFQSMNSCSRRESKTSSTNLIESLSV